MELDQTNELSVSVHKAAKQAEPEPTAIPNNLLYTDDVGRVEYIPTIEDGTQIMNPASFIHSPADPLHQRSHLLSSVSSLTATDDDVTSRDYSPELEIPSPEHHPAKNHVNPSQKDPKLSKYTSSSVSAPLSMTTQRARVEAPPLPNPARRAISGHSSTVQPHLQSSKSSAPNNDNLPVLERGKTRPSLDAFLVSNPKSLHRISLPPASVRASTPRVDDDSLDVFEYDLDRDPTEETYLFRDQFHERSHLSAILSARFIHANFEKTSDLTAFNDELSNCEGDPVTEFIEPDALGSVGPHDSVTPPYALDSATVLGNSDPTPTPDYCDLDLEGAAHVMDPFTVLTMDDVINRQPWGSDTEPAIDPSTLRSTPVPPQLHPPSSSPTPFRNFHSRKRARTPSPPLAKSALTIRIPPGASASTFGLSTVRSPREVKSDLGGGGGKAKFYKKGALQTPPHLSSSQLRRSVSGKTSESIHISRQLSPSQVGSTGSPLSESSASDFLAAGATSTSSLAAPNEATNEDATVISSGSGSPPRANGARAVTSRKGKDRASQKGPYRIRAVNELSHCHQCRRSTPHPKMRCHVCPKLYCISCIVKRYHNIEFQQFKKDFDCPACLDTCNCTSCCDKRREVYVSSRHVKFDKETMAKLLSGEIRSLPDISAPLARPGEKLKPGEDPKSRRREPPPTEKRKTAPARRKRVSNRRDTSDEDYDESGTHVNPSQAALQTQRMLEESGSGRYWGAVYSISGERIGMSYVGSNLRNVTVETDGFSPSVTNYLSLPSRQRKKRVYVGRWQDTWGFCPETPDGSSSEDEKRTSKRGRNTRELGRARFCYIGNQKVIRAWRKAQARTTQQPPTTPSHQADDVGVHASPPLPPGKTRDQDEGAEVMLNGGTPNDGEDEDDMGNFWIMEDKSSPKKGELPFLADVSRSGPSDISDILDVCPNPALDSCGQEVTQEDLFKAVTSSLQAVGTAVLLPQPPPSPPPLAS